MKSEGEASYYSTKKHNPAAGIHKIWKKKIKRMIKSKGSIKNSQLVDKGSSEDFYDNCLNRWLHKNGDKKIAGWSNHNTQLPLNQYHHSQTASQDTSLSPIITGYYFILFIIIFRYDFLG